MSWKDDVIRLGKGSLIGHHILATGSLDESIPIRYIGLSTGWGAEGDWFVEEDNGKCIYYLLDGILLVVFRNTTCED